MKSKDNRRNILYTSDLLNTLYNLKTLNITQLENGNSYAGATTAVDGIPFTIGLCTKEYNYHLLTNEEILMMEMLLSWEALVNEEDEEFTTITFSDIDWMRNRQKRNKSYIEENHRKYMSVICSLSELLLIYGNEEQLNNSSVDLIDSNLINVEYIYDSELVIGIKYNLGQLGSVLKTLNQRVSIEANIFRYSSTEFMKYQIMRYMVTSIFMNRVKKHSFTRTHKSILKAITYTTAGADIVSYLDYIIDKKYLYKYLNRYYFRLNEVMQLLKEIRFIRDFNIIQDKCKRGIMTSCGKVEITTNLSNMKRSHGANLSRKSTEN